MVEGAKRLYDHMEALENGVSTPFGIFQPKSRTSVFFHAAMPIVALALAALVGADELGSSDRMLFGFSLNVANVRIGVEAEAGDIERK